MCASHQGSQWLHFDTPHGRRRRRRQEAQGGGQRHAAQEAAPLGPRQERIVSMEVGMREFKKRLAASGSKDADTAAAGASTVEDLTQDVRRRGHERRQLLKNQLRREDACKEDDARGNGMTLAEVKAQLEREQKERVEYRIQTLRRDTKPAAAPASAVPVPAATSSISVAPELVAPVASPDILRRLRLLKTVGKSVSESASTTAVPSPVQPVTIEKHVQDTQAYTPSAPPTASLSAGAAPASSAVPPSNPVKNEFIADDMEEDLMFAMALEEVERKLATPQKPPPSSEAVAATDSNSLTSVNLQAPVVPAKPPPAEQRVEIQPTQSLNATQPQPTETVVNIKQPEPAVELSPEVLEEMERLRRENELLRRSNELLQAAVTSPVHAEAPVDENFCRSPEVSTAHDSKNESAASPKDNISRSRSTARYLDLARCDSDQDMKQTVSPCDQIPDRTIDRHSSEKHQHKPTTDKEAAAEQQIHTDNVSELSSAVPLEAKAPSMQLPDHSTPSEKDSPVQPIATEQEADLGKEVVPTELSPSKRNVDEHSFHATAGSDGDVSDVSMSENDGGEEDEDDPMEKDGSAPRTATIDSGNYTEYKVHQEDELEADEDEYIEESPHDVSEDKVNPAPASLTPVDSKRCETVVVNEPDGSQSDTPANSEILERTTAPSNSDDDEEDAGEDEDEFMVVNRVKRREVMAISSSSSSSESELEEDEADDTPSSNEATLAVRPERSPFYANGAAIKGEFTGGLQESKVSPSIATSTSSPAIPVKSMKRKTPGLSSSGSKRPPSVKSSLLWPALDEFYDFLLDLSPRNVRQSERKRENLQQYFGGKIPTQHSSIEDYCNVQLEAIMEELVASVSNTTDRRGGGGSAQSGIYHLRQCHLAERKGCPRRAIFSESGFTGNTSNSNDYILTFDASGLGKKASSDFMSGDLVLLRSPRWKNYEMCVFGVVLCDSVVAVGGKSGPGGKGGSGASDQICVLIRAQQRDRDDAVENFGVLTELCLSNQRASNWRWSMQQVHNTTTSAREFQAVKAISFFSNDLKQVLLRGQIVPTTKTEKESVASCSMLSPRLLKYLHKHYNDSQLQAILGCLGEDSRVIIQGPVGNAFVCLLGVYVHELTTIIARFMMILQPGTGKTKTILGLLSALLDGAGLSTLQKTKGTARIRVGASLQNARTSAVSRTVAETSIRVLVAAPSNAAVDELVLRVLSEGLYDGEKGESYRPRIVRVGRPESSQQLLAWPRLEKPAKARKTARKCASTLARWKKFCSKKRSRGNDEDGDVLDAFWADERRMNVAITRAKSSLWIVGNSTLLKQSRAWRALIQHTKDHSRYIGDGAATLFASSSSTRKTSKTSSKSNK
ncbi:P-loop containing nucleoside triphosphate hydrolase [Phytophthora cactorum]|nr:P-loop containing nucleoside triphosphate hydrolase [Phytophthora cactorum]